MVLACCTDSLFNNLVDQIITVLNGAMSNISVPGLHDDVMGYAGGEGSHGHNGLHIHNTHSRSGPVLVGICAYFYHFTISSES